MSFPGPPALGRGIVISAGASVSSQFALGERVRIDDSVIENPARALDILHRNWVNRKPVVVELAINPATFREPQADFREPYELDPSFEFPLERLHFLLWANNYDARGGEPIWWWAKKAARVFPNRVELGGIADVLVDDVPMWCDGGPRQSLDHVLSDPIIHSHSIELGKLTVARGSAEPSANLAADQLEAVIHQAGPARIIAPAGSGKTRVLTERIKHLISDRGWEKELLCAVAYNKRAAAEMLERTADVSVTIRTLNSLGLAICNGTGGFAKPPSIPYRTVIDETEVRRIIEGLVELRHAPNTDPFVPYLEGLRSIRLGLEDPPVAEVVCEAPGLADIFPRYCEILSDKKYIDFDGQLYDAIKILLRYPEARLAAQKIARHLLVDEFQDLTPAHLMLLRLISAPRYEVFGVGDDDQVIYGFSGATPKFLVNFQRYFPSAKAHALEINYRCSPAVINAATNLLGYNEERIKKTIRPVVDRSYSDNDFAIRRVSGEQIAEHAVESMTSWNEQGAEWTDIALLTRVNSTLLPVQLMLIERDIPCRTPLTESVLDRTGIRTVLAYLRIGLDLENISSGDILETVRRPGRKIARNVVEMMTKRRQTSIGNLEQLAEYLSGNDSQKVYSYVNDLRLISRLVSSGNLEATLRGIRLRVGLGDAMSLLDSSRRDADRSTHADDLAALEQVAHLHNDPADFESWLRALLRKRSSVDGVELSTIHRVKGREWPNVIVYEVSNGLLPHRLSIDESEERRLLHVAITRSTAKCVVLAKAEDPSQFLDELTGVAKKQPKKRVSVKTEARQYIDAKTVAQRAELPTAPSVVAEVGLSVRIRGGYEGEIVELLDDRVLVLVGQAKMSVNYNSPVTVNGRNLLLLKSTDQSVNNELIDAIEDALKSWRSEASRQAGVSAFIVLSNAELRNIAVAMPKSLEELALCKGIGAVRLERWGDEMLSIVENSISSFEETSRISSS